MCGGRRNSNGLFMIILLVSQIQVVAASTVLSLWYFWMCFVLLVLILTTVYAVYKRSVYLKRSRVCSEASPPSPVRCISPSRTYTASSVMTRSESSAKLVTSMPSPDSDVTYYKPVDPFHSAPDAAVYDGPVYPSPLQPYAYTADNTLCSQSVNPFAQVLSGDRERW